MKKFFYLILLAALLALLFFLAGLNDSVKGNEVVIERHHFSVEVVDTPSARAQGLSDREQLLADQGMLFVFEEEGVYPFWMKDMKFPIDIIWINNDTIVDIWANAQISESGDIPTYTPKSAANYVFEVNAGFVSENGVKSGDKVSIDINK